ncbi:hypothetical protein DAPPUDRAFT_327656 [Daphnia pulex]|uniref:BTB domain-containing protein n=1 Tax=Daphnia pulex TaxID=6669 RepID=E9HBC6_DAPPU|nr:hypothetical protein DAPPUDRAFT_327656 [Daphnia pulex]|eukprot:EFX70969.1 hypothetical protein DAPPUDRAFT_327656 [Daphnia pulex]
MPSDSGNESAGTEEDDDVIFHVGLETVMRIPARRSVLSKKNDVFQAMFCGPYTQSRESLRRRQASVNSDSLPQQNHLPSSPDHIYDPDVDGRAFKNLISFLYGETVELRSVSTAMETLHAAEKYLCEGLMKICATYLADQLNTENVLYIYQRTCMYPEAGHQESGLAGRIDNRPSAPPLEEFNAPNAESPQANAQTQSRSTWCSFLLNSSLEFIDKNASAVLLSEEFEELDAGKVESIVIRDGLHLQNEIEVLAALIRWSVFECHRRQLDPRANNQRFVLGHLVWHVRFSVMSPTELQQATAILDTLDFGEVIATLQDCGNNKELANRSRDDNHYPLTVTKPRMYLTSKVDTAQSVSVDNLTVSASNRKTCLTEKFFVCLACIFE